MNSVAGFVHKARVNLLTGLHRLSEDRVALFSLAGLRVKVGFVPMTEGFCSFVCISDR